MIRALAVALFTLVAHPVTAQLVQVKDLTISEGEVPVRLVGYGLVVGLDGTGDRVFGTREGNMTVRSVANLLRNLGIEVPEREIRTRNAAAVLVTAEASPYSRPGGRFDVSVASLGDATSLRGGQLWQTPLLASVGGSPMAVAQGNLLMAGAARTSRRNGRVETSSVLTDGAVALVDFGGTAAAGPPSRLLLRRPDLSTAQRISVSINAALGAGVATVEDPGSIALALPQGDATTALVTLGELTITPAFTPLVVIDAQSGMVAAGGDIGIGPAVVSHEWLTLTVTNPDTSAVVPGGPDPAEAGAETPLDLLPPGSVRADAGIQVQSLAEALHAVGATSEVIGAVFRSLKSVGALQAEVVIR